MPGACVASFGGASGSRSWGGLLCSLSRCLGSLCAGRKTPLLEPRSKAEIAKLCGFKDIKHFTAHYLKPLLESGQLRMTIPDKPNSRNQKYVAVKPEE